VERANARELEKSERDREKERERGGRVVYRGNNRELAPGDQERLMLLTDRRLYRYVACMCACVAVVCVCVCVCVCVYSIYMYSVLTVP
jgi:hypothetical protein